MNLFAVKVIYLGTVALFAAVVFLLMGNPMSIVAMLLGFTSIFIGARNIYERPPKQRTAKRTSRAASSGFSGPPIQRGLRESLPNERFDVHGPPRKPRRDSGVSKTVRTTLLVVLGSSAVLGIQLYAKLQQKPERPPRPRGPVFSAAELPNRDAELLLLGLTEATSEDYEFYRTLRRHLSTNRYEDAIRHVGSSDSKPRFAAWLLYLGYALHETGQHERAAEVLSSFIEVQSKTNLYETYRGPTLYNRASALIKLERYQEAVDDLTALIDEYPETPEAHALRSLAYEKMAAP